MSLAKKVQTTSASTHPKDDELEELLGSISEDAAKFLGYTIEAEGEEFVDDGVPPWDL